MVEHVDGSMKKLNGNIVGRSTKVLCVLKPSNPLLHHKILKHLGFQEFSLKLQLKQMSPHVLKVLPFHLQLVWNVSTLCTQSILVEKGVPRLLNLQLPSRCFNNRKGILSTPIIRVLFSWICSLFYLSILEVFYSDMPYLKPLEWSVMLT